MESEETAILMLGVGAAVGFVLHSRFLKTLKTRHPDVLEALGGPNLFLNNSIKNGWAVQRFLHKKEYLALNDPLFTSQCNFLRSFGRAYLVFLLGTLAYLVVFVR